MGKIKNTLIDTPLEDVATPNFVYEQAKIEESIRLLRKRGENELADMLAVHLLETERFVNE